jgi:hypothetical protein
LEPGNPTSLHCRSCGTENDATTKRPDRIGKTYQVVIACAACGSSFVVLARN